MLSVEEISQRMRKLLADKLNQPANRFPGDRPFDELGLDSLMVVGLVADLEDEVGVQLEANLLWDHQTINDLAVAVFQRVSNTRSDRL